MLNLAMSELMAGANLWDARGHVMSGSNDMATRTEIFHWVAAHEDIFGAHREPVGKVGVYFSDTTRNFYPADFVASYRGVLLLLLQNHIQFRIVTPRTVGSFDGDVLVMPEVRVLSDAESAAIHKFNRDGGKLVMTGKTDAKLDDASRAIRFPGAPERSYLKSAEADFNAADQTVAKDLLHSLEAPQEIEVVAARNVVGHVATIGARPYVFLANFDGLKGGEIAVPRTQHDIAIAFPGSAGPKLHVLPFLGEELTIPGKLESGKMLFVLPTLDRGAVAWTE